MMNEREKKVTAYHEAGHALVAHETPASDPVHKVSIVARGHAGGYTLKLPTEDRRLRTKAEFLADLAVSLGGQVAEKEVFGAANLTTGASNDLRQATKLARDIITRYGMSEVLGPRTFGEREDMIFLGREITEQRDYSEKTAEKIDEEINRLIHQAMKTAETTIREKREKLDLIAKTLLEKETLEREQFEALFM
jgi:cell division protease FtsH